MRRILFVCLGNICRSPMAEGVFRAEALKRGMAHLEIDSAGTGSWHLGSPPDGRAVAAAAARGFDISGQRARQVGPEDIARFDLLLAMDEDNLATLERIAGPDARAKIRLFLDFADGSGTRNVPDPYHGGADGFDHALDLIEAGARGLGDYIASFSR